LALDAARALYLVIARRRDDEPPGAGGDGAIYRSTDGAESWTRVPLSKGVNGPVGLLIDPRDSKRLYLAAWAQSSSGPGHGGGVFLSTNAGMTWRNVLSADQHVYDVTVDPRGSGTLYAAGFESSAWRSTDRGITWQRIQGYNF